MATFTGTELADTLVGGTDPDTLDGLGGDDVLIGNGGDDVLDGGSGADSLDGGPGDDTYHADGQHDLVFEAIDSGRDTINAGTSFYLYANVEYLFLVGSGNPYGVGNELANTIYGQSGDNLLLGGAGDDYIVGGFGADWIYGEDGDDWLVGGTEVEVQAAESSSDVLVGGAGNDWLDGMSGLGEQDWLYGNAGDDSYFVDSPADLVFEQAGEGIDTVYATGNEAVYLYDNVENMVIPWYSATRFAVGNQADNSLTGNSLDNWLLGGGGNDWFDGRDGNDVFFGEAGADTFVFTPGDGKDVIGDFVHGVDRISVVGIFASFAQAQAGFVQVGNDGAINFGNGNFVVLQGVDMSQLTAADFVFV